MKVTTFTFLKHKTYLFSCIAVIVASILCTPSAYSQIDGNYGASKKGFRFGIGAGTTVLHSNWSSNPFGAAGLVLLEYDVTPYFTLGIQGQFGTLTGSDPEGKLYFKQTDVIFAAGTFNLKVALGQLFDINASNSFDDAMKKLYIGVGAGVVNSSVTLTLHNDGVHNDGVGLPSDNIPGFATAAYLSRPKQNSAGKYTENGSVGLVPVNLGTNISLHGLFGANKVDLNPNLQYNFVLSPVFDGYQPNADPTATQKVNGNQAYFVGSLTLRYKF